MFKKMLKISFYLVFALFFSLIVLVWKFPYSALEERIQYEVNERTLYRLSKPDLTFKLPFSLSIKNLSLQTKESNQPNLLSISRLILIADPIALFKGALGLTFKSWLYQGKLEGKIQTRSLTLPSDIFLQLNWQDLKTQEYPYISISPFFDLKGNISGELYYRGKIGKVNQMLGQGKFSCQGLTAKIKLPLVQIKEVKDLQLDSDYSFKKQDMQLENVKFYNDLLEGSLNGKIHFKNKVMQSSLNLGGKVKINPKLVNMGTTTPKIARFLRKQKYMPFRITGTLGNTRFNVF